METPTNLPNMNEHQPKPEQERFNRANNFLDSCDRLSTAYESGLYWEDVQRALRIAAGLEKWPG